MKNTRLGRVSAVLCSALVVLGASSRSDARDWFVQDFDSGISASPAPVLSWKAPYNPDSNQYGMMLGPKDIYSVVSGGAVGRAGNVLRLSFDGRNGWCNQCGSEERTITSAEASSGCLSVAGGTWGASIFNKSRGFSKWKVSSVNSNSVCVNKSAPEATGMTGDGALVAGDVVAVPYQCGVNGIVGGNVSRRSDCDLAINYLANVSGVAFQPSNTLSRRMYLYIPSSTVMPGTGLKLGYVNFKSASGSTNKAIPLISVQRDERLEIDSNAIFGFKQTPFFFKRDTWVYLEEVWKRESSVGASDGTYAMYAAFEGQEVKEPILAVSGLQYGTLEDFSIIGNWQHTNDAKGALYIDDIIITDHFQGPSGFESRSAPVPPGDLNLTIQPQ